MLLENLVTRRVSEENESNSSLTRRVTKENESNSSLTRRVTKVIAAICFLTTKDTEFTKKSETAEFLAGRLVDRTICSQSGLNQHPASSTVPNRTQWPCAEWRGLTFCTDFAFFSG